MDYLTNDTDLTSVADAIRTKGGTSSPLTYPSGFAAAIAAIPTGIVIPTGWAYYNGVLLPQIPTKEGYPYAWMRTNTQSGIINVVLGKSQWRTRSSATLDNWQLEYATLTADGAYYYEIAADGTGTAWTNEQYTTNYFGLSTSTGRKVFWTSHDIRISTTSNIIIRGMDVIYPT